MDFSHVFDLSRWRARFRSEAAASESAAAEGRAPDASVDEVGQAGENVGFDGAPLRSGPASGHGTGDVAGPGWAGWAGGGS